VEILPYTMETVIYPGRYENLESICDYVGKAAREAGLDNKAVYAVQLAVDEACCNIIDHAYGGEGIGELECSVDVTNGELTVILRDHGRPFNPEIIPNPTLNMPLEKIKPRGVGLYLIRRMMDKVHYESSPDTGNVLTMVKRHN
jgi:serine/threonine-protein kinase RsbW